MNTLVDMTGFDGLANAVNLWMARHGFDYKASLGNEFECFPDDGEITYCLWYDTDTEEMFNEVLDECGLQYECDSFIVSFFHELFHCETWDTFTDEEVENYLNACEEIEAKDNLTEEEHRAYFRWPVEYAATKAAVDYINENPEDVKEFWDCVRPWILSIYYLNNVCA